MAQFKVLKKFRLLDDVKVSGVGPILEVDSIVDIAVKRAGEVEKNLDSSFLERFEANVEGESLVDDELVVAEGQAEGDK